MLIIADQFLTEWSTESRELMFISSACPQQRGDFEHISISFTHELLARTFNLAILGTDWRGEKKGRYFISAFTNQLHEARPAHFFLDFHANTVL